jgi:hypothetical protein
MRITTRTTPRSRRVMAAAAAAAAIVATAGPASANDATFSGSLYGYPAKGQWIDHLDTLCAKADYTPETGTAIVKITPVGHNGPSFVVRDRSNDSSRTCTGNLSIPEDKKYRMTVVYRDEWHDLPFSGTVASGTFYS